MVTLEVKGLRTSFFTSSGVLPALVDVDLSVDAGETLAVVGESGSGKSLTALSLMRLITDPPGRIVGGQVLLEGIDLLALPEKEMRAVRGNRMSMIFQEPMTCLNPVITIGDQIAEALLMHRPISRRAARARALEMLDRVRIPDPHRRLDDYPHQLSGGMRQRVMIAMAIALEPRVLIADEPTTALDVSIQSQILELLSTLQKEERMAMIFITHDLGVVAEIADRVMVMYSGRTVEQAPVETIFDDPRHPYTQGLLGSIPDPLRRRQRLSEIPGTVPLLNGRPSGCSFGPRCSLVSDLCRVQVPPLITIRGVHVVACVHSNHRADLL